MMWCWCKCRSVASVPRCPVFFFLEVGVLMLIGIFDFLQWRKYISVDHPIFLEEMQPLHPRRRWNRAAKNDTTLYGGIGLQKVTDLKRSNECLRIKWRVHHSFKQIEVTGSPAVSGDCISWCRLGSADKKGDGEKGEEWWWVPSLGKW